MEGVPKSSKITEEYKARLCPLLQLNEKSLLLL